MFLSLALYAIFISVLIVSLGHCIYFGAGSMMGGMQQTCYEPSRAMTMSKLSSASSNGCMSPNGCTVMATAITTITAYSYGGTSLNASHPLSPFYIVHPPLSFATPPNPPVSSQFIRHHSLYRLKLYFLLETEYTIHAWQ